MRRLRHPLLLLALILLILNDHVLKGSAAPGWLTGKLSDFAGLYFFPFFLADSFRLRSPLLFDSLCLATAVGFFLLKMSEESRTLFYAFYSTIGLSAHVTPDVTDLCALLVLPLVTMTERWFLTTTHKG